MVALQIISCILLADFLSGLFHWIEDAYGRPSWPILGKLIILDNIHHHKHPTDMGATLCSRNVIPVSLVCGCGSLAFLLGAFSWQLGLVLTVLGFSNETHAWCHGKGWRPLARLLQEMGLVLSPIQHGHHHRDAHTTDYCTITNLVNPVLDRLHFWGALEYGLACIGIYPQRFSEEREWV